MTDDRLFQIIVYVPASHCEVVKDALFAVGAGSYDLYDRCSWQTGGVGQFRPLAGSTPFIGTQNQTECVEELRVEMICRQALLSRAVDALKQAHPYETPAYHVLALENY